MDGALMEIGPYKVAPNGSLVYSEGSWDEFANLLFVDQPVGTGFSYTNTDSYLHELDEMAAHFVTFLRKFFEVFPEYENDDVWFSFFLFLIIKEATSFSNTTADLFGRGIICRPTHTIHCKSY